MQGVIHQIWIQGAEEFQKQKEFYTYSKLWPQHYPAWRYKLWSESEYLPLIQAYSDALYQAYLSAPSFSSKSDIARWTILYSNPYEERGLYVDTDYESYKPCDWILSGDVELILVALNESKNKQVFANTRYNNAWIFAKQKCSWIKLFLDQIIPFDSRKISNYDYVWSITGPKALTLFVEKHNLCHVDKVRILPHSMIEVANFANVQSTFDSREQVLQDYPFAIGMHHCAGSWIPNADMVKLSFGKTYSWLNDWSDNVSITLGCIIILETLLLIVFIVLYVKLLYSNKPPHLNNET